VLTFLFWNLGRRPLHRAIRDIVWSRDVDIVILAENKIPPAQMLLELNRGSDDGFHFARGNCEKVDMFCRFNSRFLEPVSESGRWTIRRLELPGRPQMLVAAVHAVSKLHWDADSQGHECIRLAETIRAAEATVGHENTIVIGDLNMSPFEPGVVSARGLHAALARDIALRGTRTVQREEYPFFYNPMWGHFGDLASSPPGTYYRKESEHVAYFWYVFDQVLLRPSLLDSFEHDNVEVISEIVPGDKSTSLLSESGIPNTDVGSDHLPLVVGLTL